MTKTERACHLVLLDLMLRGVSAEVNIACAACMLSIPEDRIPDLAGMHDFSISYVNYFLNNSTVFGERYRRAAKFVARWKECWLSGLDHNDIAAGTENEHYPCTKGSNCLDPCGSHPTWCWSTDMRLVYTVSYGGGMRTCGLTPEIVIGRSVQEIFGSQEHWAVAAHLDAIEGRQVSRKVEYAARPCHLVLVAKVAAGKVVGTDGTLVILQPSDPPLLSIGKVVVSTRN